MNPIKITFLAGLSLAALSSCNKDSSTKNEDSSATQPTLPQGPIAAPEGMVWIPGGTYWRGNEEDPGNLSVFLEGITNPLQRKQIAEKHFLEERPVHQVAVDGFFMDETEVTNRQFKAFVDATGYVTMAETGLKQEDFPNAPADALEPGANVYTKPAEPLNPRRTDNAWRWWAYTKGANWKHPEGPGSTIEDKMDHPVVCVNYDDAAAYAKWAGKRLPTEAEWERASRGGHEKRMFIWGPNVKHEGKWMANCFQGDFPNSSVAEDGFHLSAPVKSYPPNDYGLYDMAGNVWEICSDYYNPRYYEDYILNPVKNPTGPIQPITEAESTQLLRTGTCPPPQPGMHPLSHLRVARGGSFLCHFSYCLRFRPAARHYHEPLTPTHHTGFRCVKDAPKTTPTK
ncbi:formylglycine-generating enzyme family protein [Rubritalea tangerina]|uniref:Formylglycine-generating enzyme family protein n=1 Tax=Rubritalea tangerina TaxID=430798 RepID=A0ABW4Z9N1_9BACT